jgi:hypothetical protein
MGTIFNGNVSFWVFSLRIGRAWAIKESLHDLWAYRRKWWALRHWKRRYLWATHSRLKPVIIERIRVKKQTGLNTPNARGRKHRLIVASCLLINNRVDLELPVTIAACPDGEKADLDSVSGPAGDGILTRSKA